MQEELQLNTPTPPSLLSLLDHNPSATPSLPSSLTFRLQNCLLHLGRPGSLGHVTRQPPGPLAHLDMATTTREEKSLSKSQRRLLS